MDEEFRKPYEYEEEKRGLILLFAMMIIVIDILPTLSFIARLYDAFSHIRALGIGLVVIGILFILYTVFTAAVCITLNKKLVTLAKLYLIIQAVYTAACYVILFFYSLENENMIGTGPDQYQTFGEMLTWELLSPLVYIAVFTVGWFLYFIKSKRCKEFLKNKAGR